ncbi:DUF3016 domain-containing protein [Pseudaquabacterium pictum]|uniref:DUF3016 domain-containing protein n=1 Tax=Pseudaquabacterium pictum TaxID=2315236 RepID=A0A480AXL5_9BURK|nr:DUF3016 domain-containing protein [Rubrivivax pictus]GCL64972.1 hypothetical protein AQPW35_40530 [Rubrivivax pictus]
MRKPIALMSAALLCAGLAHAGTVEVQFEQPDRYTDVGPRSDATAVQTALRGILQTLAAERLPANQSLTLAITDIDLAGEIEPTTRRMQDVRVMGQHPDWPRISLRYTLRDGGRVLAEGQEVVSDMAYLMRSTRAGGTERLPYEQRMLSEWFDKRFVRQAH